MSGSFKVGEVAVGVNFVDSARFNGLECIVLEGLHVEAGREPSTGCWIAPEPCYFVEWADDYHSLAAPRNLRRKQLSTDLATLLARLTASAPLELEAA